MKPKLTFLSLPFDIHVVISSYLRAKDLVQLSHVSRAYHAVFASRDALPIWNYAISNQGMPPCPPDIPAPRYCSLVLGPSICSICCLPTTREANFELAMRFCATCESEEISVGSQILKKFKFRVNAHLLVTLVPRFLSSGDRASAITRRREFVRHSLSSADVKEMKAAVSSSTNSPGHLYYARQLRELAFQYEECCKTPSSLMAFVSARVAHATARMQHAVDVWIWLDEEHERQEVLKKAVVDNRVADIKSRLVGLGWDSNLFSFVPFHWYTLVEKPVPVTDREWKELLPQLKTILNHAESNRYRQDLLSNLQLWYVFSTHAMLPEDQELMFEWNDVTGMTFFEDVIAETPDFTLITQALLNDIYLKLHVHIRRNRNSFRGCLVKALRAPIITCPIRQDELQYHTLDEDDPLLTRATSLFTYTFEPDPLLRLQSFREALITMVTMQPYWTEDLFSYTASTLLVARRVLTELGFPLTALMSEVVESLRGGVACLCAHDTHAYWEGVRGYANLVFHVMKFHETDKELFLLRL